MLDLIDHVAPEVTQLLATNAPERVEVILQKYIKNYGANANTTEPEGLALHLINLTGFNGNTYFNPFRYIICTSQ